MPYRRRDGRLEFCLITNSRGTRWGFPKGIVDPEETAPETALKESREEAGLHGVVDERPLGDYLYSKWGRLLRVTVYLMRVTRADEAWDESGWRRRRWSPADEARGLLARRDLRRLLETAVARLQGPSPGLES